MTLYQDHDPQLHELLAESYAKLREPDAKQRQAVIDGFGYLLQGNGLRAPRRSRLGSRWIWAAACIVLAVGLWLLRFAPSTGLAYGIDGVPDRLMGVRTISLRGWELEFDRSDPTKPPVRLPFEIAVKRPGMFRHTFTSISTPRNRTVIRHAYHLCDGTREWWIDEGGKASPPRRLHRLDARLQTETFAQIAILMAVLGPPEAPFKKVGRDNYDGRRCDLYEARMPGKDQTTLVRIWFDPVSGLPVRLIRDNTDPTGKLTEETELTEIRVNVPLADNVFRPQETGTEAKSPTALAALKDEEPALVDAQPVCSGSANQVKLELWHTLRIADNAALMVWRRSAPARQPDKTRDWLSDLAFSMPDATESRPLRHAWVDQSNSSDRWSWSLLVTADGKPLGRGVMRMETRGLRESVSFDFTALRFSDQELQELLAAARKATLDGDAPEISLADLRAQARQLATK